MEQTQYHQMLDVMGNFSKVLKEEISKFAIPTVNLEHILYIYYGVRPPTRLFYKNFYTATDDKTVLKKNLIEMAQREIRYKYRRCNKTNELELISEALFEKDVMFGNTLLIAPESIHAKFRANHSIVRDAREILVEIVDYWFELLVKEEHLQTFDYQNKIEKFYVPPVEEKTLKDRVSTNMEEKEYDNMLLTVEELLREYDERVTGLAAYTPRSEMEKARFALFNIPPTPKSRNDHEIDQERYRKQCIVSLQQSLQSQVYRLRNRWKLSYLELLSEALVEENVRFGKVLLDTPEEIRNDFLDNFSKYERPSDYFIKIVSYWQRLLIEGKQFEVFVEPKSDSKVVTPSSLGRTAISSVPRGYTPALTEEQRWAEREAQSVDTSSYEDFEEQKYSDDGITFDEDSSNWSYNEEHD